jgi:hypothetical protein
VRAPHGLRDDEYTAIRRMLDDRQFHAGLHRAVREVFRLHPDLSKVRFTITR